jgi:hypothetical protein
MGTFGCGSDEATAGPEPLRLSIRVQNVAPSVENTQCIKVRLPNAEPIAINRIVNELSSSSHHFVVSSIDDDKAGDEQPDPFDCEPFRAPLLGAPLTISQKHLDTYNTPAGVGYPLVAHQMIHLELHYINLSDKPVDIEAHTNLYPMAAGEMQQEASVMLVGDLQIQIPAKSSHTLGPKYQALPPTLEGVNIFAMTGHTHRLGTNVSVGTSPSVDGPVTSKYDLQDFVWDEPEVRTFSPAFQVPQGGGFTFSCTWNNPTNEPVIFGESANQEMCFFWAYYYPRKAKRSVFITPVNKL